MLSLVLTFIIGAQAPSAVITGQVLTAGGKPAAAIRVAVQVVPETDDAGPGVLASLDETDADGYYRLEGVPAGRYYLQAGPLDSLSYYPGVDVISDATPIQVVDGAVLNLDFKMLSSFVRIRGRVPLIARNRTVRVLLSGATTAGASRSANVVADSDGFFEFTRVASGRYTLTLNPSTAEVPPLPLAVQDADIDLASPSGPGFRVAGRVGLGPFSFRQVGTRVVLSDGTGWWSVLAETDAEGSFVFPSVPQGSYNLTISGLHSPSATINVMDSEITGIQVPAPVELKGRSIVEGEPGWVAPSVAILVDATRSSGEKLSTVIRPDGSFRLPVTEGSYRLAVGKLPPGLVVRSVVDSASNANLLEAPLVLDGTAPTEEIVVTFARIP